MRTTMTGVLVLAVMVAILIHTNVQAAPMNRAVAMQTLEAKITARGVGGMRNDIKAKIMRSRNVDEAVRGALGMSPREIRKHGLLGPPGSQVRQLFTQLNLPH
jgi:hypothetical protein